MDPVANINYARNYRKSRGLESISNTIIIRRGEGEKIKEPGNHCACTKRNQETCKLVLCMSISVQNI